ncbi:hypothetical protein GPX89_02260 [Nocardia sp. ET3-3]|uniref:Uncharacterized protein n=1 Tax=Nocardia terrae TaxID=2675851 RepID=A0A7K1UNZ9_9NOCA|nr:hypothetical protein [Nocardia terrae]MVU76065.1 hypothetical protein [Nocardia terrae]
MNLFGDLPGFAGGPMVPVPAAGDPAPVPEEPEYEELSISGDIRDRSWDSLPTARPGHRTSLWEDPERAAALQGPLSATDPVLGVEATTQSGIARVDRHITYHEIEMHSTVEVSTTIRIKLEAHP